MRTRMPSLFSMTSARRAPARHQFKLGGETLAGLHRVLKARPLGESKRHSQEPGFLADLRGE